MNEQDSRDALDYFVSGEEFYQSLFDQQKFSKIPMAILVGLMRKSSAEFRVAIKEQREEKERERKELIKNSRSFWEECRLRSIELSKQKEK